MQVTEPIVLLTGRWSAGKRSSSGAAQLAGRAAHFPIPTPIAYLTPLHARNDDVCLCKCKTADGIQVLSSEIAAWRPTGEAEPFN